MMKRKFGDTSILVVESREGRWFIVTSLSTRTDTQIIAIEPVSGKLEHLGFPNEDIFSSEKSAIEHLGQFVSIKRTQRFEHLVGYVTLGAFGYLLCIKKSQRCLTLPPNHSVMAIEECEWIAITLQHYNTRSVLSSEEKKHITMLLDFPIAPKKQTLGPSIKIGKKGINATHFFCETLDITRAYPSYYSVLSYEKEFVWNDFLAKTFADLGLRDCCVVLLEGFCQSTFLDKTKAVSFSMLCRRSCFNPGTRYHARGLNSRASPGNEWEIEHLLLHTVEKEEIVNCDWSSYLLRRGTVPIRWSSKLGHAMQLKQAEIVIEKRPYEGIELYYRRLLSRYGENQSISCINLLRTHFKEDRKRDSFGEAFVDDAPSKRKKRLSFKKKKDGERVEKRKSTKMSNSDFAVQSESNLTKHFEESLRFLKRMTHMSIDLINLDWLYEKKVRGGFSAVTLLWSVVKEKVKQFGFSKGSIAITKDGEVQHLKFDSCQRGIFRVNCADSLDRTNLCAFFIYLLVLPQQCRTLGVNVCGTLEESMGDWDHLNSCDTLEKLENLINLAGEDSIVLEEIAKVFIMLGNIAATLFTGTKSIHTQLMKRYIKGNVIDELGKKIIDILPGKAKEGEEGSAMEEEGKRKKKIDPSSLNDKAILVKRRFENTMKDGAKQKQFELFLGYRWGKYFSSLFRDFSPLSSQRRIPSQLKGTKLDHGDGGPVFLRLVSGRPAFLLNDLPAHFEYSCSPEEMLLHANSPTVSLSTTAKIVGQGDGNNGRFEKPMLLCRPFDEFIELDVFLPKYCRLIEMGVIIRNGISKESSPFKLNAFVGTHMNNSILAFQDLQLPRCEDGTKLVYVFPPHLSGVKEKDDIYDFQGVHGNEINKIRVVKIFLHRLYKEYQMTVGEIQLFGVELTGDPKIERRFEIHTRMEKLKKLSFSFTKRTSKVSTQNGQEKRKNDDSKELKVEVIDEIEDEGEEEGEVKEKLIEAEKKEMEEENSEITVVKEEKEVEKGKLDRFIEDLLIQSKETSEEIMNIPNLSNENEVDSQLETFIEKKTKEYQDYIREFCGREMQLDFQTALKLELARVNLKISTSLRNEILLKMGYQIKDFDPNSYIFFRDEQIEKELRKLVKTSKCSKCTKRLFFSSQCCRYCRKTFCKSCMFSKKMCLIEFRWRENQSVCNDCRDVIKTQEDIIELLKKTKEFKPSYHLYDEFFRSCFTTEVQLKTYKGKGSKTLVCLSQFPFCGMLHNVHRDPKFAPAESILFPLGMFDGMFWKGAKDNKQAVIPFVLPSFGFVQKFVMIVDREGFNESDIPTVHITFHERFPNQTTTLQWDIQKHCDENGAIAPRYELEFDVPEEFSQIPVRIIKITLSLDRKQTGRLHMGRIQAFGERVPSNGLRVGQSFMKDEKTMEDYSSILKKFPILNRVQLKTVQRDCRDIKVIDIKLVPEQQKHRSPVVSGFRMEVRHSNIGPPSQIRKIAVFELVVNEMKSLVAQKLIQTFEIPRVARGTDLIYDFESNHLNVHTLRFEIISTYGAAPCYSKFFLHQVNFGK